MWRMIVQPGWNTAASIVLPTDNCSIPTKNHRQRLNSEHYRNIWKIRVELSNKTPEFDIIPLLFFLLLWLTSNSCLTTQDPNRKRSLSSNVLEWRSIKCFITMFAVRFSSSCIGKIPTNKRFEKKNASLLTRTKCKPYKGPSFVDCVGPKRSGNKLSSQAFGIHLETQPI